MLKLTFLNIAIFQGALIGFILLRSQFFKSKPNQYLAYAILALSWSLLNLVLDITQAFERYPLLEIVDHLDSVFLFPVFILLFVVHQVGHPIANPQKSRWLFLPYFFSLIYGFWGDFDLESIISGQASFGEIVNVILGTILFFVTILFVPWVLSKTIRYIQHADNEQDKKWLIYLWYCEVAILSSWFLLIFLSLFIDRATPDIAYLIPSMAALFIHWVAYVGVYKLKLANDQKKIRTLLLNRVPKDHTPANAGKPPSVGEIKKITKQPTRKAAKKLPAENNHFKELQRLCSEQKIYRDSSLDRDKVASLLGISPSYLSQLVNTAASENFSSYINRHRVEEAKTLILDTEFGNYSLLAIGLECGFSSKTTYYNWFKKITGMTPNAFRKVHQ